MSAERKELLKAINKAFEDKSIPDEELAYRLMEIAQNMAPHMIELVEEVEDIH